MHLGQRWLCIVGKPGYRYTASEVARALGVSQKLVIGWIKREWLRASLSKNGVYRIKHSAVRRALLDYVAVSEAVADAQIQRIRNKWPDVT